MTKNYCTLFALLISFSSIAQIKIQTTKTCDHSQIINFYEENKFISSNRSLSTPSLNIVWESDFSNTSDWIIGGSAGITNEGWEVDQTVNSWYLPAFSSTSGGNFAELGNGDPSLASWNGPTQVEYTITTTNPINVYDSIGSGNALLSFEEFGARFNDLQAIQISIDGTNFTTVGDNLNYTVTSQAGGSNPYPNPSLREINLSSYLGSTPTSVWIRFSWTTNYPNQATDPNVWITYGWCIDDVKIVESPGNRVIMEDAVTGGFWIDYANYSGAALNDIYGLDYSVTPLSQLQNHPFAIEAVFKNEGTKSQSVELTYNTSGTSTSTGLSNLSVLNPGDSVLLGASFSPTVTGTYSVDIWGIADSVGAGVTTTLTNIENRNLEVTNYIYGKDLGEANSNSSWILGGPEDQWHFTTRFEMYANEQLYGIRAYITDESVVGAEVKVIIYEADTTASVSSNGLILIDESDNYTITSSDLGSWVDIPFLNPISLFSGYAYECGIAGFQHPSDSVFVGTSGTSLYNGEHSLFDEQGLNPTDPADFGIPDWYYLTATPMVRMNFDPSTISSLHVIENSIFNIYPNPSDGLFVIELDRISKYDITISNALGQTILSQSANSMTNSIDLSSFGNGLYTIDLKYENTIYSKKIIVE